MATPQCFSPSRVYRHLLLTAAVFLPETKGRRWKRSKRILKAQRRILDSPLPEWLIAQARARSLLGFEPLSAKNKM